MKISYELNELLNYLKKYIDRSFDKISEEIKFESKAKSKNFLLIKSLINNFKNKEYADALLQLENVLVKTIQLKPNGKAKEAMSFPPINYERMVKEKWDESELKHYLMKRFLFFVFKMDENGTNKLINIIVWQMPYNDLEGEVKLTWNKTKDILLSGNIIKSFNSKGTTVANFPTEASTNICHVRPHGRDGLDVRRIPNKDNLTGFHSMVKYSFWFNHEYLNDIVKNYKGLKGE